MFIIHFTRFTRILSSFILNIIREAEITKITPQTIKIVQLREELVFEADATGLYKSFDGKKVTVNNTGASRLLFEFACLLFNLFIIPSIINTLAL